MYRESMDQRHKEPADGQKIQVFGTAGQKIVDDDDVENGCDSSGEATQLHPDKEREKCKQKPAKWPSYSQ